MLRRRVAFPVNRGTRANELVANSRHSFSPRYGYSFQEQIAGGPAHAQRLARRAHVMARATAAFLERVGLQRRWASLDVGCGDGDDRARTRGGPDGARGGDRPRCRAASDRRRRPGANGLPPPVSRTYTRPPSRARALGRRELFLAQLVRNMRDSIIGAGAATAADIIREAQLRSARVSGMVNALEETRSLERSSELRNVDRLEAGVVGGSR